MSLAIFDQRDVERLGRLLADYEAGNLARSDAHATPRATAIETYLGKVIETIPASFGSPTSGTVSIYSGDGLAQFETTAYSLWSDAIAVGCWVHLSRCPYSGRYFVVSKPRCEPNGSGSGDCDCVLPATYCLTFHNVTGCECLDGETVILTDGVLTPWTSPCPAPNPPDFDIYVQTCTVYGPVLWITGNSNFWDLMIPLTGTCDPLNLVSDTVFANPNFCSQPVSSFTVELTQICPASAWYCLEPGSSGSGSSGSGGGSGTIETDCCEEMLPENVTATFSNTTGDCSCLEGLQLDLFWDFNEWHSPGFDIPTDCGSSIRLRVFCDDFSNPYPLPDCRNFKISLTCPAGGVPFTGSPYPSSCSCEPFELVFTGLSFTGGCCEGTFDLTITG
jgi:hypothetical protein